MPPVPQTAERLLRAACEVVCELGWAGATSRAVSSRAGVNLALINYHFQSKDRLLLAALERAMSDLSDTSTPPPTSIEELKQTLQAWAGSAAESPQLQMLLQATLRAPRDALVAEAVRGYLNDFRSYLEVALRGSNAPDAGNLSQALAATLDGLFLHALIDPSMKVGKVLSSLLDRVVGTDD